MNTEILLMYQTTGMIPEVYLFLKLFHFFVKTPISSSAPKMKSLLHRYLIRLLHSTNLVTLAILCLIGSWLFLQLFYCKQLPVLCLIGSWVVPAVILLQTTSSIMSNWFLGCSCTVILLQTTSSFIPIDSEIRT